MNKMAAALVAALSIASATASAETAFETAFRTGTLDAFEVGDRIGYSSAVAMPATEVEASTVTVELADDDTAALELHRDGASRLLGRFDATVGNPLAMYFLERTIRSVSERTGGSDFYLRNRIRDALRAPEEVRDIKVDWQGHSVGATEIVLAPFENDPNLDKLGTFGDLRIHLVVGEDVPGWYHTLRAEAGQGAYSSSLSLMEVAE